MNHHSITVSLHAWPDGSGSCAVCGEVDRSAECTRIPVAVWLEKIRSHREHAGLPAVDPYDVLKNRDWWVCEIIRRNAEFGPQLTIDSIVAFTNNVNTYSQPIDFSQVASIVSDLDCHLDQLDEIISQHDREVALVKALHLSSAYKDLEERNIRIGRHKKEPVPLMPLTPNALGEVGWYLPKGKYWHFSAFYEFVVRFATSRSVENWQKVDGFLATADSGDIVLRTLRAGDPTANDAWRFRCEDYVTQWKTIQSKLASPFEQFVVVTDQWRRRIGAAFSQQDRFIEAFGSRPIAFQFTVAGYNRVDTDIDEIRRACYLPEYISRSSSPPYQR